MAEDLSASFADGLLRGINRPMFPSGNMLVFPVLNSETQFILACVTKQMDMCNCFGTVPQ
jgi:hypothetical protein